MSGQPTPPTIQTAFAVNAGAAFITNPLPVQSQISITPGAASLADGFVPVNFLDEDTEGGIPIAGEDMNGILFLLSAWIAYLAAGQKPMFDAVLAPSFGGYKLGAELAKADGTGSWFNLVDGNISNPDTGGTGWLDGSPVGADYMTAAVPAGTTDDFTPPGFTASTAFIDCEVMSGAAAIGSLPVGINGQQLTVSNSPTSTSNLQLLGADASATQPKFRMASTPFTLLPGSSTNLRYSSGVNQWLLV